MQIPGQIGVKFGLKIFYAVSFEKLGLHILKANRRHLCIMHSLQLQAIRWMSLSIGGVFTTPFVSDVLTDLTIVENDCATMYYSG